MIKYVFLLIAFLAMFLACTKEKTITIKPQEQMINPENSVLSDEQSKSEIDKFFSNPISGSKKLDKDISISQALEMFGKPDNINEEFVRTNNTNDELKKITYEYDGFSITWALVGNGKKDICISRIIKTSNFELINDISIGENIEDVECLFNYPIKNQSEMQMYETDNVENGVVVFKVKDKKIVQVELYRNIE